MSATSAIAIKGGHLIDPSAGIDAAKDILLKDGRVVEVAAPGDDTSRELPRRLLNRTSALANCRG